VQNNNNPKRALDAMRKAFHQAGAGPLSESITSMLLKEASDRNVDQIKAFGRVRTVQVVDFLKSLPQTASGAIDLSRMERIGGGGTQDVHVLKDRPRNFVIKVSTIIRPVLTRTSRNQQV